MTFVPFRIRVYNALLAAIAAGFSAELEAVGQPGLLPSSFMAQHPLLITAENVGTLYVNTEREAQARYWVETAYNFEIEMWAFGTSADALQLRLMYFEFAATQVLDKDRTLGGLLRGMAIGDSEAPMITAGRSGTICDGIVLPVRCEPAVRISIPEHS